MMDQYSPYYGQGPQVVMVNGQPMQVSLVPLQPVGQFPAQYGPQFPAQYGPQFAPMPWMQPAPQPQADLNSQLSNLLLPLMVTLPGITNAQAAQSALAAELAAITPPAAPANNPPTQAEVQAINVYSQKVAEALKKSVGNDAATLNVLRRQVMLNIITPLAMQTGGSMNLIGIVLMAGLFGGNGLF